MTYAPKFVGFRDCCHLVVVFTSEEARAEWEQSPHPHGEEDGDTE